MNCETILVRGSKAIYIMPKMSNRYFSISWNMRKLHLINVTGKKIVDSDQLYESTNNDYQLDVDWYFSHGYSKAEDMFHEIEGNI